MPSSGNSRFRESSLAPPAARYARSDGLNIAFQVIGEGPRDLVFVPGFVSNLELTWDWPPSAAFFRAFAAFSRLILFDKRGTGLSDRVKGMPTMEDRIDDLRVVMDAAECARGTVVGVSEGAPLAITFAARYPERVSELVLYAPLAKAARSDDYPWAKTAEWWERVAERFADSWGSPEYMEADVQWRAPSEVGNPAFLRWWSSYRRLGASPGAAAELALMNSRIDVRALLPEIKVPTLIVARSGDRVVASDHARYVAERIPGASHVELPGDDHLPFVGDATSIVRAIAEFLGWSGSISVEACPASGAPSRLRSPSAVRLTDRELDVMEWVARGKTNSEIATALYVTESTVRKHLQNAYKKLGVASRTAAVAHLTGYDREQGDEAGREAIRTPSR